MRFDCGEVVGMVAARENPAVKRRMQRLHAAVHHLGKSSDIRHARHDEARLAQRTGSSARGDEFEAARGEAAAQFRQATLVGHTQQGSWHTAQSPVLSLRRRAGLAP